MAVSIGNTRFNLQRVIDRAIGRCKIPSQKIGAEHQSIARENLKLVLADVSNKITPLWCQERLFLGLYEGVQYVTLPQGTIDIVPNGAYYRTAPRVGDSYISAEGTASYAGDGDLTTATIQTSTNGNIQVQFLSPTAVNYVGILPYGNNWYNLVFEASNDGLSWTQLQAVAPPYGENATYYADAVWAWYEILSPAAGGSLFFRVRETSGGVLQLRELYCTDAPYDIPIARLNRDQFMTLPNKTFPGRPLQYWLDRSTDPDLGERCIMNLWPVPSTESEFASVLAVRKRYIADVSDYNAQLELPTRWYDAIIWQLAGYLASEYVEVDPQREQMLVTRAEKELMEAISEERDNSPIQINPNISAYTRM